VNRTTNSIVKGPDWSDTPGTTRALPVTIILDRIITNVTISIPTVTETIEEITATIHSEEKDALTMKITEISEKQ